MFNINEINTKIEYGCIDLEERILYLLHKYHKINDEDIKNIILDDYDNQRLNSVIDCLKLSNIIEYNNGQYILKNNNHVFLRTLDFFKERKTPILKSEIKQYLRFKNLNLLLMRMKDARILCSVFVLSKHGDYLFYADNVVKCKNDILKLCRKLLIEKFNNNENLADIVQELWLENDYDNNKDYLLNKNELKVINYMKKITDKYNKVNAMKLIEDVFKSNNDIGKDVIISLIKKHKIIGNINNGDIWLK